MPSAELRRDLYRDLVLAAAEREFARVGFAGAKVAAIATAADLSLATVYKTFPGKQDIWDELHTARMTALLAHVDERTAGAGAPLERMLRGIGAVAEYLMTHPDYLALSLRASSGWLAAGGGIGVQSTVWSGGLETIAAGVEAARAAGELGDLRPQIAAGLVVSALQVWLSDWMSSGRDRDKAQVVDELVDHLGLVLTSTTGARSATGR